MPILEVKVRMNKFNIEERLINFSVETAQKNMIG